MAFSEEPEDKVAYTAENDRFYSFYAPVYDFAIKRVPIWQRWIGQVLPYVQGPRVLEVSFGTGSLLTRYAPDLEVVGLEYNRRMITVARRNVQEHGRSVALQQGDINHLPYASGSFDTIVNTMAFTGYPDGNQAMAELSRVLRPDGRLLMVDINHPRDHSLPGKMLIAMWKRLGDIVRDIPAHFRAAGLTVSDQEIGGWGSVHLYVAVKSDLSNL